MAVMHEEIIDAKDFKIRSLEKMVKDKDAEIARLNKRLEDMRYWATVSLDHVKSTVDKKKEILKKVYAAEMERPVIRSLEGGIS